MDAPLTPLEFARRARRLYGAREAVVDGERRWTYAEFFDRCDRWSCWLRKHGVGQGDRVAYIAPNTHAQLESFYAIPQIGAILVPINYRLTADDFAYVIEHSGARIVCAHADYLEAVDRVRSRLAAVDAFVALEGSRTGWLEYETCLAEVPPEVERPVIAEGDVLTITVRDDVPANAVPYALELIVTCVNDAPRIFAGAQANWSLVNVPEDADVRVGAQPGQGRPQALHQLLRQGIAPLGPAQRDAADAPSRLDEKDGRRVGRGSPHRGPPVASRADLKQAKRLVRPSPAGIIRRDPDRGMAALRARPRSTHRRRPAANMGRADAPPNPSEGGRDR